MGSSPFGCCVAVNPRVSAVPVPVPVVASLATPSRCSMPVCCSPSSLSINIGGQWCPNLQCFNVVSAVVSGAKIMRLRWYNSQTALLSVCLTNRLLDGSGDSIQGLRHRVKQSALVNQKKRLVDTFFKEVNSVHGLCPGRVNYDQLRLMAMAKHSSGCLVVAKGSVWQWRGEDSIFWLYRCWPMNMGKAA